LPIPPSTDPSVRNYRTGLLPWVVTFRPKSGYECTIRGRESHLFTRRFMLSVVSRYLWLRRQRARPQPPHLVLKRCQFAPVAWHSIIPIVSKQDYPQPLVYCRDGILQASPKLYFDQLQLGLHPFPQSLPKPNKLSLPGPVAHVQGPQEGKALRLTIPSPLPIPGRKPSELEQPRLVVLQLQIELLKSSRSSPQNRSASSRFWNPTTSRVARGNFTPRPSRNRT
jgi:hypothetical protein